MKRLRSIVFMGLPWPMKAAGIRVDADMASFCRRHGGLGAGPGRKSTSSFVPMERMGNPRPCVSLKSGKWSRLQALGAAVGRGAFDLGQAGARNSRQLRLEAPVHPVACVVPCDLP
ncbi:hypothetical protein GCM10028796_49840 [Ramlibacter monticola]